MSHFNAFPTYQYDVQQQAYFWPHQTQVSSAINPSTTHWNPSVPPPPPSSVFPIPSVNYASAHRWDPTANRWIQTEFNSDLGRRSLNGATDPWCAIGAQDYHQQIGASTYGAFQEENVVEVNQRDTDQTFVDAFLAGRVSCPEKMSGLNVNISDVRNVVKRCLSLIKELKGVHDTLKDTLRDDDDLSWDSLSRQAFLLQSKIKDSLDEISSPEKLRILKGKLKKIRKKKERMRRLKLKRIEEKGAHEKHSKLIHEKLDTWLRSVRQEYLDAEMEKKMKKEADGILSEVRRKKAEATRTLALVKSVERLRVAKKKSAEAKGLFSSAECDSQFANAVSRFESILSARLLEYGDEERTLQAMLDEERRESKDAEERRRVRDHEDRVDVIKRDVIRSLFGPEATVIDKREPRFYYWEFYTRTERDLDALIHVRREWDLWLVPNGSQEGKSCSSNVPIGWVKPSEPSSDAWAAVLDKH